MKRVALSSNYAVAYAVKACNVDVVAAYPVTPQTAVVEKIAEFVNDGELDAEFLNVESEHSALSVCIGASLTGARTFTATCSQGLALMHEILFIASGLRAPIVMSIANRTLSAPINIHCDYQDTMASRDCNWAQLYVSSAQEAYDSVIQAFKLAERDDILLPVMVCYDGFVLSHTFEPVIIHDDEEVLEFVPKYKRKHILDPDNPITMGAFVFPDYELEFKFQVEKTLMEVPDALAEVDAEFRRKFGRSYGLLEELHVEDSDVIVVSMGAIASTAKVSIDRLRKEGKKVSLLRPRLYRPTPADEWKELLTRAKAVAVIDRVMSSGAPAGPLFLDVATVLVNEEKRPLLKNYIMGIGGRDVTVKDVETICRDALRIAEVGKVDKLCTYYGVREG